MTGSASRDSAPGPLLAAVACLILAVPGGQQARLPQFRAGVEVILIDVSVVDGAARPVEGLVPDDFSVTVDNRPRRIVSAQFVKHGGAATAARDSRMMPVAPFTTARAAVPPQPGRNVLIVVDEESLDVATARVVVRAAERFVDDLPPNDRAGAATIPRPRERLELTTRRSDTRNELRRVRGSTDVSSTEFSIGLAEALQVSRGAVDALNRLVERECEMQIGADSRCRNRVEAAARQLAREATQRAERSLVALHQLAVGLRQLNGPKTVLLVSGGMTAPDAPAWFSRLESALATAQISLYTLHVDQSVFSGARPKPTPTAAFDRRLESNGIESVAAAAGGTVIRAMGTIDAAFDRVATEMTGSYLLGIEVAATDRDGLPHQVKVRVDRPQFEVRARRQYVVAPAPECERTPAAGPVAGPVVGSARPRQPPPGAAPVRAVEVTSPEVEAILALAGEYVADYEVRFAGLVSEETYDQSYSVYRTPAASGAGSWSIEATRRLKADYLLVKAPSVAGWIPFRDVFEADGTPVRERAERLRTLFLEQPATALERAREVMDASSRYNIGPVERNVNLPTLALMLLHPANRFRFVFRKLGEHAVEGIATWRIGYSECVSPTIVRGLGDADNPARGEFWIDPRQGRVLRTVLSLNPGQNAMEIAVVYRSSAALDDLWVPAEMREVYSGPNTRLVAVARYSNLRRFQVTTQEMIKRPPQLEGQ